MLEVVSYEPIHLEKIQLRACHATERPLCINTSAVTLLSAGEPLGILGWYMILPGVAQGWALLSERITGCPLEFHRAVRKMIDFAFEKFGLRRMQFSVRCGYLMGYRWAKSLGFVCEGVMNGYAVDGNACWLFARVK